MTKTLCLCAVMSACAYVAIAQKSGYRIENTFHIASGGGWDYIAVSPVNGNVYVSHATQVNILSKTTGDSVGVINNTTGVHGIAFAPEFGKGFTSNGKINTVTVFDLKTNAELGQIKTGENPDAIMYDAFTKKVYVCDGRSKDLTIIDPATDKVISTVPLAGKPETAVSDNAGKIYVNIEDKNEIAEVNTKTYKVENSWKIGKGESPAGLAIDVKTKRLFAGCDKLLVVLDATKGKVIKELPIGDHCDGVAFDPELQYVFSSNGDGTLTIIKEKSANEYEVLENLPTAKGARTIAVDEKTHAVYLPTAEFEKSETEKPHSRPNMIPGTFKVLVVGMGK